MNRRPRLSISDRRAGLLAAWLACASGVALANPTGGEVVQGSAGFATAGSVLTVTPSANTVLQWRSFNVAPGETVRFVQPAGSSVLNRVPEGGLSIGGGIESAGRVLFLTGSSVSGGGIQLDLAGAVDSSLRLRPHQATQRTVERPAEGERPIMLTADRVFVIGAASVIRGTSGRTLLVPGASAELGQLSLPNVRVFVAAPAGAPVDLDALVTRRPVTGIFNALFAPRPGPRGAESGTAVAQVPSSPVEERVVQDIAAPVEERRPMLLPVALAPVEERVAIAFAAPVEERIVFAFAAPVEERGTELLPLVPAPVEDRQVVVVWIAPVEDRVASAVSRPGNDALKLAAVAVERPAVVEPRLPAAGDGLIRVASAALSASAVVAAPQAVVRLPEVRRRMPRIMMDHKGGIFHL